MDRDSFDLFHTINLTFSFLPITGLGIPGFFANSFKVIYNRLDANDPMD